MHWSIDENMAAILEAISFAASRGADVCSFPELAVTGFHRQIAALAKLELLAPRIDELCRACAQHSIAVAVGAPTFGNDGRIYNSHLLLDEAGRRAAVIEKNGLTEPEATFFARGTTRPLAHLHGWRCSAILCREIEDAEQISAQLPRGAAQLVFWPGLMRPDPDVPLTDPPSHVRQAQQLAARLDAYIVQANWPLSLNDPEHSKDCGHSAVVAPDGRLLFKLPKATPGVGIFTLGEDVYEWHARED